MAKAIKLSETKGKPKVQVIGIFATGVSSITPWAARPKFIEGVDRPQPLVHLLNNRL